MGVSFEQIAQGALDTGKLLVQGMEQWNLATGNAKTVATPPLVAVPTGGGVSAQPQGQAATPAPSKLASIPAWVWVVGLGYLAWRYS